MAVLDPIANLQDVKNWLATLSAGGQVNLSASMFSAPLVQRELQLLPDSDPIALTITHIDVANATLQGTATILGEADTTACFVFSQPDTQQLQCAITFTLPSSLQWSLIPGLTQTVIGDLVAKLTPNPDLSVIAMEFDANIRTLTATPLRIPIALSVPTFAGDWTLSATAVPLGDLTGDALDALAGGVDVLGIIPAELKQDLQKLSLDDFQVAFNVAEGTCSMLRLRLRYQGDWKFFDDKFVVQDVAFDVEVFRPFPVTSSTAYDAKLYATMQIPPLPKFQVGGQFPDPAIFVQLAPDAVLRLTDVFAFFNLPVPTGMPEVEISTLGFTLHPGDAAFQFNLAITKQIPLYKTTVFLDNFLFNVGAQRDQGGTLTTGGGVYAHFTIGQTNPTTLMISGNYSAAGGLDLIGQAEHIPIGELIADLAAKFNIPAQDIPEPIRTYLEIDSLRVELNTGAQTFDFTCVGKTTISGTGVDFIPTIHVNYSAAQASVDFTGVMILHVPQPGGATKDLAFALEFSKTRTDTWLQATFSVTGGVVEFGDLAAVFGVTPPPIPSDLDLSLLQLKFRYDFSTGALTFGAQSQNYGTVAFVATPIDNTPQYFFLLNANKGFSLSDLPIVGAELAKLEDVSVTKLKAIISTLPTVDTTQAGVINAQIQLVLGSDYPHMPSSGINGRILLAGELEIGPQSLPLSVSLAGPSRQTALPAPASAGFEPTAAAGDGVTWFNVQRSFGPVSIARIGVLFQPDTQTLWFELDAALKFGPLTLTMEGLGIGSPLKSFAPQFCLQGIGVDYRVPPLEIAGALINLAPPGSSTVAFAGAVTISTATFTVQAFGYYGKQDGFTSMFLFGDLLYPFGGPPAFFVTGVALGFGYNSGLRIPAINEVQSFPFVQVLANPSFFGPNATPATVLGVMLKPNPQTGAAAWVAPQQSSLWAAAGITFTSFELVNSAAIVFVETGSDLVIALVGVSTAQFPQRIPGKPNEPLYANIELDLLVRFAPDEGVFSLEAVLASSSFLLDRACVLTGGFAFYVWYGRNQHAGDFVVSLGGYHPGFTPPTYYPSVPRVGFHWSLDSSVAIQGGTYLAFTPAALMVGGLLKVTYQSGNLKAWFNAHADIIVRWKPFSFDARVGVTIGASYTMDLLATSATFSLELGVDLELWGPPTRGRVSVDWYIISFSIEFGDDNVNQQPVLDWDNGVARMLPNTGTEAQPNVLSVTPCAGLTPTGPSPSGLSQVGPGEDPPAWLVRGSQFGFSIDSPIPATTITVGSTPPIKGKSFDVYPLRWKDISATQTITITNESGADVSGAFDLTVAPKDVPAALWGAPPETANGRPQVPDRDKLLVPGQNTGIAALVKVPTLEGSAGPVSITYLAYDNLDLPGATDPLDPNAKPVGDIPIDSTQTVSVIASNDDGIASAGVKSARDAIYSALTVLNLAPTTANDSMSMFAANADCLFAAQPLLVQTSLRRAA